MTSEVIVMNKFGLALAADSAVTVEHYQDFEKITKTYNSANKLFALSKYAPVGVMLYNTVTLGGVPIETLVKSYRKHLGERKFDTLDEYAQDFFKYLDGNSTVFQDDDVNSIAGVHLFSEIRGLIRNSDNKKDFDKNLDEAIEFLEKFEEVEVLQSNSEAIAKCHDHNEFFIERAFQPKPSYLRGAKNKVKKLFELMFLRKRTTDGYSGLIFAGFGESQFYPSVSHFRVDCYLLGRVRRWLLKSIETSHASGGEVIPLADTEVMETLLSGVNPNFGGEISNSTIGVLSKTINAVIGEVPKLSNEERKDLKRVSMKALLAGWNEHQNNLEKYRKEKHETPLRQAISALPIAELGTVAETLVNVSHIYKRVNPNFETVGGPVDVAVISKGDGLVWVKRKHYFDASINPTFALKYLD